MTEVGVRVGECWGWGQVRYLILDILLFIQNRSILYNRSKTAKNATRMSHLIDSNHHLQSICPIPIPCRQVIPSKFRHILKNDPYSKQTEQDLIKEQKLMANMRKKLADSELIKLQAQNQKNLKKTFQKVKKKLRVMGTDQTEKSSVLRHFQGKQSGPSLSSLIKMQFQKIQIDRKYHTQLQNRLQSIREATLIEKDKQNYRNWLNHERNSPFKNPNFNKMNFVLEKVKQNHCEEHIFKDLFFKNARNSAECVQYERYGGAASLSVSLCKNYSPRSEVKKKFPIVKLTTLAPPSSH